MSEKPLRVVKLLPVYIEIIRERSDVLVKLNGLPLVTVHYLYGFIDNATQWTLAESIAASFSRPSPDPHVYEQSGLDESGHAIPPPEEEGR